MTVLPLVLTLALSAAPTEPQIDEALAAKDFARAESLARAALKENGAAPATWIRLSTALHEQGRYAQALEALDAAKKHHANPMALWLRRGRTLARLGQVEPALAELEQAVKYGFAAPVRLKTDADFEKLRGQPRFTALIAAAERNARPCESRAEARQFDFWLGEWSVTNGGIPAGQSKVERILDGCVLLENWTSVNGNSGKSFNLYDASTGKWRQTWVDSGGGVTDYAGALDPSGAMVFLADDVRPGGQKVKLRMSFSRLSGGRVRQLIESSTDGGRSWAPDFDGTYTPVAQARGQ